MTDTIKGKTVLVTGAAGTIGRALVERLGGLGAAEIRALDNNESELFLLAESHDGGNVVPELGDIRDRDRLARSFEGVDVVLHAGAVKHVSLCERNPLEAVQTNILGVQNVIQAAIAARVKLVLYTSSDKAVNPTNVMGASKLMGEQLMNAANLAANANGSVFTSTRFGNVLGSRGSVMPLFREQIRRGGPVTLTDPAMTRFVMTTGEAVDLVLEAAALARGGEVFITKMAVIRIEDLAHIMVEELAPAFGRDPARIEIRIIGPRPGEKLFEELMNSEETRRSVELKRHFAVLPAFRDLYERIEYAYPGTVAAKVDRPYQSCNETPMAREALRGYLRAAGLLGEARP
ncbi:MAG: SDR family NAD(P)-dependent oxidoreductase [Alphaproteobacteria bacterium]